MDNKEKQRMTGREIAAEVRGDVNQGLSEIDAGHASGLYGHFNDDMEVVWEDQYYELTREEQIAQAKLAKKMRKEVAKKMKRIKKTGGRYKEASQRDVATARHCMRAFTDAMVLLDKRIMQLQDEREAVLDQIEKAYDEVDARRLNLELERAHAEDASSDSDASSDGMGDTKGPMQRGLSAKISLSFRARDSNGQAPGASTKSFGKANGASLRSFGRAPSKASCGVTGSLAGASDVASMPNAAPEKKKRWWQRRSKQEREEAKAKKQKGMHCFGQPREGQRAKFEETKDKGDQKLQYTEDAPIVPRSANRLDFKALKAAKEALGGFWEKKGPKEQGTVKTSVKGTSVGHGTMATETFAEDKSELAADKPWWEAIWGVRDGDKDGDRATGGRHGKSMKDVIESAEKAEASPEDELGGGGWGLGWLMGRGGGKRTRKRDANKTWGEWLTGLVFGDVQGPVRRRFLDLPYDPRLDELEDELDVLEDDLDYMEELLLDLEALWDAYELGLQAAHAFVSIRLGQIKGSLDANAIYALVEKVPMDHIPKMLIHVMEEDDIDIKSMVAFDLVQAIRDIETQVVRITEEIDMANDELLEDLDDILNDNDGDIVDHGLLKRYDPYEWEEEHGDAYDADELTWGWGGARSEAGESFVGHLEGVDTLESTFG